MLKRIHAQNTPRWVKGRRATYTTVIVQSTEVICSRLPRDGTKAVSHDWLTPLGVKIFEMLRNVKVVPRGFQHNISKEMIRLVGFISTEEYP